MYELSLSMVADPKIIASLFTLVILEIILGIDNVIFISLITSRLSGKRAQTMARFIGLAGAMVLRILFLFSLSWLIALKETTYSLHWVELSVSDMIFIAGGMFLVYKSIVEIWKELEGSEARRKPSVSATFAGVVAQIMLIDVVFSVDSVIAAVGITQNYLIIVLAIVISIIFMMFSANRIADLLKQYPSSKMLALAFLLMIGVTLVMDGFGHEIERGFIYAAVLFACFVEALNVWRTRASQRNA